MALFLVKRHMDAISSCQLARVAPRVWRGSSPDFLSSWMASSFYHPGRNLGFFYQGFCFDVASFGNMMAGHMVVGAFLGLVVLFGAWVALPAVGFAIALSVLEVFVALLQAYIFVLLSAVFIGQMHHPQH